MMFMICSFLGARLQQERSRHPQPDAKESAASERPEAKERKKSLTDRGGRQETRSKGRGSALHPSCAPASDLRLREFVRMMGRKAAEADFDREGREASGLPATKTKKDRP